MATWGEKLVPLDEFRGAAKQYGRTLDADGRRGETRAYLEPRGRFDTGRGTVFGGVYNNSFGLEALLEDARRRGAEAIYCLGDLGGFGPHPEKVWPLLEEGGVQIRRVPIVRTPGLQLRLRRSARQPLRRDLLRLYGASLLAAVQGLMGSFPRRRRIRVGERELLLVHGSPRKVNEFLFESTSPVPFLEGKSES